MLVIKPSTLARAGIAAVLLLSSAAPGRSAIDQEALTRLSSVKQWSAEVIVTSDCDSDDGGGRTVHNRVVTNYQFTRRAADTSVLAWDGRATTTYTWNVALVSRDNRDVEESSGTFETDARLELGERARISTGRAPSRTFTRKNYVGVALLSSSTSTDGPPAAELFDADPPTGSGSISGKRMEYAYSLLGGIVVTCPAQRQWTIR